MSAAVVGQVVLSGAGAGVSVALIAVGITLIGGLRGAVPLAQGDLAGGAVGAAVLTVIGAASAALTISVGSGILLIALALATGIAGGALLFGAGNLSSRSGLETAATALALGLLVRDGITHAFPRGQVGVPDPLRLGELFSTTDGSLSLGGGTSVPARLPGVIGLGALLLIGTAVLLRQSGFGRGVRALSQDGELAALSGVDANRVSLGASALAGLLAALAGLLAAPASGLAPDTGVLLGLAGLLAAIAGGLGSVRGAVVAALAVGLGQAVIAQSEPAAAEPAILAALALLAVVRGGGETWVAHYR